MSNTAAGIQEWALTAGLEGLSQAELVTGYCERLVACGLPVWRASVGADTLHPLIDAQGHRWIAGEGLRVEFFPRLTLREQNDEWRLSTWKWMLDKGAVENRWSLSRGEGADRFPLLADLAASGGTDYWTRIVRYGEGAFLGETRGLATSWATREPGGFRESELALIRATLPAFTLAFKATMSIDTARTVVSTYLGESIADRILRGDIERGKVIAVRKVLWFSDLVGFTRLADTLPHEQLIGLLNAYADCLVGVVHDHGGQVLKFLGDGILAAIPGESRVACGRALDAAAAAREAVADLNRARSAAGLPVTGFTLALHEGEVLYGNVGSRDRLDFTVVGPSVNEASRIQALCRSLDQPILVSESFARACGSGRERLVSVGRYALRGVERPQELFTLDHGDSR